MAFLAFAVAALVGEPVGALVFGVESTSVLVLR